MNSWPQISGRLLVSSRVPFRLRFHLPAQGSRWRIDSGSRFHSRRPSSGQKTRPRSRLFLRSEVSQPFKFSRPRAQPSSPPSSLGSRDLSPAGCLSLSPDRQAPRADPLACRRSGSRACGQKTCPQTGSFLQPESLGPWTLKRALPPVECLRSFTRQTGPWGSRTTCLDYRRGFCIFRQLKKHNYELLHFRKRRNY